MDYKDLLKEMQDGIGNKDPLIFFSKLTDALSLLFEKLDSVEKEFKSLQLNTILAIHWDSRIAENMISEEIQTLRKIGKQSDGTNIWNLEIDTLLASYMNGDKVHDYSVFCTFWQDLLGYHPFLEKRK